VGEKALAAGLGGGSKEGKRREEEEGNGSPLALHGKTIIKKKGLSKGPSTTTTIHAAPGGKKNHRVMIANLHLLQPRPSPAGSPIRKTLYKKETAMQVEKKPSGKNGLRPENRETTLQFNNVEKGRNTGGTGLFQTFNEKTDAGILSKINKSKKNTGRRESWGSRALRLLGAEGESAGRASGRLGINGPKEPGRGGELRQHCIKKEKQGGCAEMMG